MLFASRTDPKSASDLFLVNVHTDQNTQSVGGHEKM